MNLKKIIAELEEELKDLHRQYKNAGIGTEGEILNQIENKERKIKKLKALATTKAPEDSNINIYIFAGLKKQIIAAIDNILAKKIPKFRNGETYKDWMPYMTENKTIDKLLSEFKVKVGYPFSPVYLEDNFNDNILTNIDRDVSENSVVVVVDLLAINDKNIELAKCFNTCSVKQLLFPICADLDKDLQDYMQKTRDEVFNIAKTRLKQGDCDFADSPRENNYFIMQLKKCFPAQINNSIGGLKDSLNGINTGIL